LISIYNLVLGLGLVGFGLGLVNYGLGLGLDTYDLGLGLGLDSIIEIIMCYLNLILI